jgi:hypothetical protein
MEISWTDCVKNEGVLQRIKKERNFLHTIKRGLANCIGHLLCRNCLLRVTEGKVDGMMEGPGRHEQLLEIERGSTRSNSLENSLWKRLWTSHKTDYVMIMKDAETDYITEICCLFQQVLFLFYQNTVTSKEHL